MLEAFKILNDFDDIVGQHFFLYSTYTLRGHNKILFKTRCRLNIRTFTFSNRFIYAWLVCHNTL